VQGPSVVFDGDHRLGGMRVDPEGNIDRADQRAFASWIREKGHGDRRGRNLVGAKESTTAKPKPSTWRRAAPRDLRSARPRIVASALGAAVLGPGLLTNMLSVYSVFLVDIRLRRRAIGLTLLLAACLAGACDGGSTRVPPAASAPMRAIDVPPANYTAAAWLDNDKLVLSWRPKSGEVSEPVRLVEVSPEAKQHRPLPFTIETADCWRIEEGDPVALPDGRLGFLRQCQPSDSVDASVIHYDIVAVDLRTQEQEVLARLGDASVSDAKVNVYSFSIASDLSWGVVYLGSKICDSVASFDAKGIHPLDFRLGSEPSGPNLADAFTKPCEDTVNARTAALSPDSSRIGLFIAEAAKGKSGEARLRATWELVVIGLSDGSVTRLISDLEDPHDLSWSPDGAWLVLGDTADSGASTTLLVGSAGQRPTQLDLRDRLSGLTWAPTGKAILGLADRTDPGADGEAKALPVIIDVSDLVKP
jgi:hypothetical protein